MSSITKYSGSLGSAFKIVRRVEQSRISEWLNSAIDAPTTTAPIYTELEEGYLVYPSTVNAVSVVYLRKPAEMKWAYTTPSGRPVYDAGNSVQPEWNETELNDIILIACDMIGVNLRDGELIKAAEVIKND